MSERGWIIVTIVVTLLDLEANEGEVIAGPPWLRPRCAPERNVESLKRRLRCL
jgi:hypothetical protein